MTYITHITLNTGHTSRISLGDVTDETVARMRPWLAALIETGQEMPLPVSDLSNYTAHATSDSGAMLITISAPSGLPIITLGAAARSRHTAKLWVDLSKMGGASGTDCPSTPWCAVVLWPALAAHTDAMLWLGDLERCIAWAWILKKSP